MIIVTTAFPLLDGPLSVDAKRSTADLVAKMAADLLRYGTHADERLAIGTLSGRGYAMGDIVASVDKAMALAAETLAREAIVAREMAKP
jgi:hypothetical protein